MKQISNLGKKIDLNKKNTLKCFWQLLQVARLLLLNKKFKNYKKIMFRLKSLEKKLSSSKIIRKALQIMNELPSAKYQIKPNEAEKKFFRV